jgi:hypothetical protein
MLSKDNFNVFHNYKRMRKNLFEKTLKAEHKKHEETKIPISITKKMQQMINIEKYFEGVEES